MKISFQKYAHFLVGVLFFIIFSTTLSASVFLKNEGIVDKRAVEKMEIMGKELKEKTGVNTYVIAVKTFNGISIKQYEQNISKKLKQPFILLTLARDDMKVDIVHSGDMSKRFDKDGVLSPYPQSGTILPILASKKGNDKYSAALLNGYGDIVDQVSQSYGIKLKSSIGNANKTVINILKVIFYTLLLLSIGVIIYKKRKVVGKQ